MVVGHYTNKDGKLVVGRVVPREGEPNWGTVERRIERVNEAQKAAGKRATRKDAVVMADVVVTLSLKVPAAMKRALEKEAKAEGKSTGAYARGILADGLMAIA